MRDIRGDAKLLVTWEDLDTLFWLGLGLSHLAGKEGAYFATRQSWR